MSQALGYHDAVDFAGLDLPWRLDPLRALQRWPLEQALLLLHSGRVHPRWSRHSVLAEPTGWFRFDATGSHVQGSAAPLASALGHKPLTDLRRLLRSLPGVWIGCISYDIARWIEQIGSAARDDRDWPILELAHCPGLLVHDAITERWRAVGQWADGSHPKLDRLEDLALDRSHFAAGEPVSVFDRAAYEAAVRRAQAYIAAGDVFQVNLAQRFTAPFRVASVRGCRSLYLRLAQVSPAWYGAYLELDQGRCVASTSPELFLQVDPDRTVTTRPIKGTRPANVEPHELLASAKDAAELHMIVDLLRNDLGRVCSYGTVRVEQSRVIESHPTVHHGVATITGQIHPRRDLVDLLRATLPGGSITGAPKVRAMQIIEELEPVRRGPYCGCIGLLSAERTCLSIAIRTLLVDTAAERVDFSVGGGIVADSSPAAEHQETLDKAQAMLRALGA